MTDEELTGIWTTLDPGPARRRRIQARVFGWLQARDRSIAAEWIELFRLDPLTTLALVTVSAIAVAAVPFGWLARVLL